MSQCGFRVGRICVIDHTAPESGSGKFSPKLENLVKSSSKYLIPVLIGLLMFIVSAGLSRPAAPAPAEKFFEEGLIFEEEGRLDLARQRFEQALKRNPELARAHLALGAFYLRADQLDRAEASILRVIELLPRTAVRGLEYQQTLSMAYNNLGALEAKRSIQALLMSDHSAAEGHWRASTDYYRRALEVDPSNIYAQENLRRSPLKL